MKHAHDAAVTEARERLQEAQALVAAQIAAYPAPISGCDAQFNHLLSERARIAAALRALATQRAVNI